MINIGVITAVEEEFNAVKSLLKISSVNILHNLNFYCGSLMHVNVILVKCGVGKVNSARACQCLIDVYDVDYVINIGVGGGVNNNLKIGDVVIGDKTIQYDFNISGVGNYEIGEIIGLSRYLECSKPINKILQQISAKFNDCKFNFHFGTIGTADLFLSDKIYAQKLQDSMGIDCVDMEGGAIAQVAYLNNKQFAIIRGITDIQNDNNANDYENMINKVSILIANIFSMLVEEIVEHGV